LPFFCLSCGFWPSQVAVDGNRKCSVRVTGDQVRGFKRTQNPVDVDKTGSSFLHQAFTAAKDRITPPKPDCSMLRECCI